MGMHGAGFSSVNFSWPQISNNDTSSNFTEYSGSEENTDISQELSSEKSVVTKSISSNKSSAHPSTLMQCSDSGQHRGKSKTNGKMTLLIGLLILSFNTSKCVSCPNRHESWYSWCKLGYCYLGLCVFPFPCLKKLNRVHLPELDVAAFCFALPWQKLEDCCPYFRTALFCSTLLTL